MIQLFMYICNSDIFIPLYKNKINPALNTACNNPDLHGESNQTSFIRNGPY